MKIKQMIIILFVLLSVIPMTFLGITNMYFYNGKLENVIKNDLKNTTSTQMKAIENFLAERRYDAAVITRYQIVADMLRYAEAGEDIQEKDLYQFVDNMLILRVESSDAIESITILDENFYVIACSEANSRGQKSILKDIDNKYFSKELQFTPVIETNREGSCNKVIAAIQEIYSDQQLAGYLVLELNLSFFEELRTSAQLLNNGTIYLIDGSKTMITAGDSYSNRDKYVLKNDERQNFVKAYQACDNGSKDGVIKYSARGDNYLSYYSKFNNIDWIIISSINIDQVLQTKQSYIELAALIIIVLVFILISVNCFISHNIVVPIKGMILKFERIKETQDYSIRMEQSRQNEIGVISREINSLLAGTENYIRKEKQIQANLRDKAERDPLTGIYNKNSIEKIMRQELDLSYKTNKKIACIFVDIDNFKDFNSVHGHRGGDQVLSFVAQNLMSCLGGLVGRQGGDEFLICIPEITDMNHTEALIRSFIDILNHGVVLEEDGNRVSIGCSIGIAVAEGGKIAYSDLIIRADEAMYTVKNNIKNGYMIWTPACRSSCGLPSET